MTDPADHATSDAPSFDVEVAADGARTVLALRGELDAYTVARLAEEIVNLGDMAGRHVILDLGAVGFVDSAGLSSLVAGITAVRDGGGAVSIRAVSPQLRKLFEITGLTRMVTLE
ncbi:MAG TPA: STAS domain-containing protein [Acidimicrobiales bacterium]|nr:STAS domain-containing protein [Acidimicrobiales bacterium]